MCIFYLLTKLPSRISHQKSDNLSHKLAALHHTPVWSISTLVFVPRIFFWLSLTWCNFVGSNYEAIFRCAVPSLSDILLHFADFQVCWCNPWPFLRCSSLAFLQGYHSMCGSYSNWEKNVIISVQGKKWVLSNCHGYLKTCYSLYDLGGIVWDTYLLTPITTWSTYTRGIMIKKSAITMTARRFLYTKVLSHAFTTFARVCQWQEA